MPAKEMLISLLLSFFVIIGVPSSAQNEGETVQNPSIDISFERGEGEVFLESNAFLIFGDLIERSLRSNYFLTEGEFKLDEGAWSIFAVGIGGSESTLYATTDLAIDASPTRCLDSWSIDWKNAFTITCPLRFLRFEVKSGYPIAMLLVTSMSSLIDYQ